MKGTIFEGVLCGSWAKVGPAVASSQVSFTQCKISVKLSHYYWEKRRHLNSNKMRHAMDVVYIATHTTHKHKWQNSWIASTQWEERKGRNLHGCTLGLTSSRAAKAKMKHE